jgi:hypothetical protein
MAGIGRGRIVAGLAVVVLLVTACQGASNGRVCSAAPSSHSTGAAAAILAHQRQRGEGNDPVGVSNRMNPSRAGQTTKPESSHHAA